MKAAHALSFGAILASLASVIGCGGRIAGDDAGAGTNDLAGSKSDTGVLDADADADAAPTSDVAAPTSDAAAPTSDVAAPTQTAVEAACLGDIGASRPEKLGLFNFSRRRAGCMTACDVWIHLEAPCALRVDIDGQRHEATMSSADCAAVKSWVSSDVWLAALDTGAVCRGTDGPVFTPEYYDETVDGAYHGYKASDQCRGAVLPHLHACMQAILDAYVPGTDLLIP